MSRRPRFIDSLLGRRPSGRRPMSLSDAPSVLRRLRFPPGAREIVLERLEPALRLRAGAHLIGFAPDDVAADGASGLVDRIEQGSELIELWVDPRAILSMDPRAEEGSVTVTAIARLLAGDTAEMIEASFEIMPPVPAETEIDMIVTPAISEIGEAAFDAAVDGAREQLLADVTLRRPEGAALGRPWRGEMRLGVTGAPSAAIILRMTHGGVALEGDRLDITLAPQEPEARLQLFGRVFGRPERDALEMIGEPATARDLRVMLYLTTLDGRRSRQFLTPIRPRDSAPWLDISARAAHNDATAIRAKLAFNGAEAEESRDPLAEADRVSEIALEAELDPEARRRLLEFDLRLRGAAPADGAEFTIEAELTSSRNRAAARFALNAARPPRLQLVAAPAAALSRGPRARLSFNAAHRRVALAIEIDETELARAPTFFGLDTRLPALLKLSVTIWPANVASEAGPRRMQFEHELRVLRARPQAIAVDFGAAATAAAQGDRRGAREIIDLGGVLARQDPTHREAGAPFIESRVSAELSDDWRRRDWSASLWMALDAEHASTTDLEPTRTPLAFPPARRAETIGLAAPALALARPPDWPSESMRALQIEQMVGGALRELGEFYLPRAGAFETADEATVALLRPNLATPTHLERLRRAGAGLLDALGGGGDPQALCLTPAGDAVAAYALDALEPQSNAAIRALCLDLGAATLDVSLAASAFGVDATSAQGVAPWRRRTLEWRGGARLGGDQIDLTLYFIAARALEVATGGALLRPLLTPVGDQTGDRAAHLAAKRRFAEGVRQAKHEISAANPRWSDQRPFLIDLDSAAGGGFASSPDLVSPDFWRGSPEAGDRVFGFCRRRGRRCFALRRSEIDVPAMQALMSALTSQAATLALSGERTPTHILSFGRGALWPLFDEALDAFAAASAPEAVRRPASSQSADALKRAAAYGALSIWRRPFDVDLTGDPLALLHLGVDGGRAVSMIADSQETASSVDGAARLALWPPDLPPQAFDDPYRRRFLALSSKIVRIAPDAVIWREGDLVRVDEQRLSLRDLEAPPSPSLESAGYDISPSADLAPPGWPESCAPSRVLVD